MVTLAAEAEDAVRHAHGAPERLRVVATSSLAESVAPALLAAFSNRAGAVDVSLGVVAVREMAAVLQERLADVALGPKISELGLETVPVFRYRLTLVVAPSHRLARAGPVPLRTLADQTWLVDPDATDPATAVAGMLRRLAVPEHNIRVFPSQAAAWAAASEGQGVAPAVAHLVVAELSRHSLVGVDRRRDAPRAAVARDHAERGPPQPGGQRAAPVHRHGGGDPRHARGDDRGPAEPIPAARLRDALELRSHAEGRCRPRHSRPRCRRHGATGDRPRRAGLGRPASTPPCRREAIATSGRWRRGTRTGGPGHRGTP